MVGFGRRLFVCLVVVLVGCDSSTLPEDVNTAPVVNAGVDRTVTLGDTVSLSGVASDADGDVLSYAWSILSAPQGSSSAISDATQADASFTPDKQGVYVLGLSVSDGTVAVQDDVSVTVNAPVVENNPPALSPISDQQSFQLEPVVIDFIVSDENVDSISFTTVSNDETLVKSSSISVVGSGTNRQLEILPEVGTGSVLITLTVMDSEGLSDSLSFTLEIVKAFDTLNLKLTASDATDFDFFGSSVAISGDYAIVGAYLNNEFKGSAYVFKRSGDDWAEIQKLTASDGAPDDHFGTSVAISGDYAVVGASLNDDAGNASGSAYVFTRSGDDWAEVKRLTASDGAEDDNFGTSVAISGDYTIVGAHGKSNYTGAGYIFSK